jgi:nitrogen fixation NifU-like protein
MNDALDGMYREVVLDHYKNPRGHCPLDRYDVENEGFNPVCGDEVKVGLRIEDGKIVGVHSLGRGCSISVSSGSMLAEILRGKTLQEARTLAENFKRMMHGEIHPEEYDLGDLEALEGVQKFPVRIKCALLPWTTLLDAIDAYEHGEHAKPSTTENPQFGKRPNMVKDEQDEKRPV